jgi:hypothetical protein
MLSYRISYATGGDAAGGLEDMLWDFKGFMPLPWRMIADYM